MGIRLFRDQCYLQYLYCIRDYWAHSSVYRLHCFKDYGRRVVLVQGNHVSIIGSVFQCLLDLLCECFIESTSTFLNCRVESILRIFAFVFSQVFVNENSSDFIIGDRVKVSVRYAFEERLQAVSNECSFTHTWNPHRYQHCYLLVSAYHFPYLLLLFLHHRSRSVLCLLLFSRLTLNHVLWCFDFFVNKCDLRYLIDLYLLRCFNCLIANLANVSILYFPSLLLCIRRHFNFFFNFMFSLTLC